MNTEKKPRPTFELPPDFKKKWVEALRSGEYKQGKQLLHNRRDDSYCCLGVACKIATGKIPDGYFYIPDMSEHDFDISAVPEILRGENGIPATLARMNDGYTAGAISPHSFLEIADWIEQNL